MGNKTNMNMNVSFEQMQNEHRLGIIDIFNYYVNNSFAAYPDNSIPYEYYDKFLVIARNYPAYAIKEKDRIIGFCFLNAYKPLPSFKETAEITYFIDKDYTGKGIGKKALNKLESDARQKGIRILLANISSLNEESLAFHSKNGFEECGRFRGIIKKKNQYFDIIWMQKELNETTM